MDFLEFLDAKRLTHDLFDYEFNSDGIDLRNKEKEIKDRTYKELLAFTLGLLHPKQSFILTLRYNTKHPLTFIEIGDFIEVSANSARKLTFGALRRLAHPALSFKLRKHLTGEVEYADGGRINENELVMGEEALKLRISELGLDTRTVNAITYASIKYVSDLVALTKEQLMRTRKLGVKGINDIIDALAKRGLYLKSSIK